MIFFKYNKFLITFECIHILLFIIIHNFYIILLVTDHMQITYINLYKFLMIRILQ